ncbi:methyltransferase domain-containing protein [Delftia sp. GW456-R20]|uniref:methyltransferase domain-containing protein n=1 Tax=Delftia sp. GW456-R20 TaxID=1827145 RepID=UPI0009EDA1F6|nr:methyltransferase domain-containing protein [Delftia sp. GW456-R20]
MIEYLVSQLPEVYQPIYGYPDLSSGVSRPCHDRLDKIFDVYTALKGLLGRQVKVLDLGCAQGFFSLSLAQWGASVHGVDFLDKNITLCRALAEINPQLDVSFEENRIENVIENIELDQYDLVLGLSVFHHIAYEKGEIFVKDILDRLASRTGVLVVEIALREEPLYWAAAQPEDPRSFLKSVAFVHEIARHSTHLAPIPRPLFVASNRCWILGKTAEYFESWSENPHAFAQGVHEGGRRYFNGKHHFLKLLSFDHRLGLRNRQEYEQEVKVREALRSEANISELLDFGCSEKEGWLLSERIHGRLLLDLLRERVDFDRQAVILSVLEQLVRFESHGLYHDDVRSWNVMVDDKEKAYVIDYGSISTKPQDCVWPNNIFLSFLIFVYEVSTGNVEEPDPLRTIAISPFRLPYPYRSWIRAFWNIPMNKWTFCDMHRTLLEFSEKDQEDEIFEKAPMEVWMEAIEEAVQQQKLFIKYTRQQYLDSIRESRDFSQDVAASHSKEINSLKGAIQDIENLLAARLHAPEMLEARLVAESENSRLEAELLNAQENLKALEEKFSLLQDQAVEYERRAIAAENGMRENLAKIKELNTHSHNWWIHATKAEKNFSDVKNSLSWRITAPVRRCGRLCISVGFSVRHLLNSIVCKTIEILWLPLSRLISFVLKRPKLSAFLNNRLQKYPKLYGQLIDVARRGGVILGSGAYLPPVGIERNEDAAHTDMTARALRIKSALESSIKNKKK